jgi:hypothetical protein
MNFRLRTLVHEVYSKMYRKLPYLLGNLVWPGATVIAVQMERNGEVGQAGAGVAVNPGQMFS